MQKEFAVSRRAVKKLSSLSSYHLSIHLSFPLNVSLSLARNSTSRGRDFLPSRFARERNRKRRYSQNQRVLRPRMIKASVSTIRYPAGCISGKYRRGSELSMIRVDSDREEFRKKSRARTGTRWARKGALVQAHTRAQKHRRKRWARERNTS